MSEAPSGIQAPRGIFPLSRELPINDPEYGYFDLGTHPDEQGYKGKPLSVVLAARAPRERHVVLEIGRPEDFALGLEPGPEEFLIMDRELFRESNGARGFKGLRNGEEVEIGRNNPGRFELNDAVSGSHLKIKRVGTAITLKDLGSTNGTAIRMRRAVPTPTPVVK